VRVCVCVCACVRVCPCENHDAHEQLERVLLIRIVDALLHHLRYPPRSLLAIAAQRRGEWWVVSGEW